MKCFLCNRWNAKLWRWKDKPSRRGPWPSTREDRYWSNNTHVHSHVKLPGKVLERSACYYEGIWRGLMMWVGRLPWEVKNEPRYHVWEVHRSRLKAMPLVQRIFISKRPLIDRSNIVRRACYWSPENKGCGMKWVRSQTMALSLSLREC